MSAKRKIVVTSALIYANGTPHLGHMVGYIQADIWVRMQKMLGNDCLYICGSDSHGTPIMIQAEKMGMSPEAMITQIHHEQLQDFNDFYVEFDNYYPTDSMENKELVVDIYQKLKPHITKRTIKQFFDPEKKMFLPDRFIKGECPNCHAKDQYGDSCEVCGKTYDPTELINPYSTLSGATPITKESEHYFFKLQEFEDFLKDWTKQGHLQEQVSNKLGEWFTDGLREWDISRDAPYFGFKIPDTKDKYFYVWLDAPIGYMASLKNLCSKRKDLNFDDYWAAGSKTELYHFIGKDIIYFHALFWPAILHGAGYRTPNAIFVNGFLTIDGQKMSKSRGTFIKARTYLQHLNPEYLRYYFAAKLSDRIEDLDINFDDFVKRVNSDLVGKFVNIASRCASFINKYFDNKLGTLSSFSKERLLEFSKNGNEISDHFEKLQYSQAIRKIMWLADLANEAIDDGAPWVLIKDLNKKEEAKEICTFGLNAFRILMIYLKPILPATAKEVESFLNIQPLQWKDKDSYLENHSIREFKPLLSRIDPKQIEAMKMEQPVNNTAPAAVEETPKTNHISIDDFNKIDLRVAKVLEADAVEGADKLLRLKVEVGNETKQIFAGIKSAYSPEKLIGRQVVIVANLAPRKMRFGLSEGMVIVAGSEDGLFIVSPDDGAKPGDKVK